MALTKISTGMLKQDAASSDLNIDAGTLFLDVSNNRVGIAETSPSQKLQVNGNIRADGHYYVGGQIVIDSNRRILAADGAANVPYITFAADTNTGLYRPGADIIGFSTAGSERVRIDASGNVGINQSNPSHKLQVSVDANGAFIKRDLTSNAANLSEFNSHRSLLLLNRNAGSYLAFGGNSSRTDIQATDLAGTPTAKNIALNPFGGNVGIGNVSPSTPLVVQSNSSAQGITILGRSDDISQLDFDENDGTQIGGIQARTTDFRIRSVQNIPLLFMTNNTERMRINAAGSIGFNTSNPLRPFDSRNAIQIFGSGGYTELMLRGRAGTAQNLGAFHFSIRSDVGGDNDDLMLLRFTGGNSPSYAGTSMHIRNDNGHVGIGTNTGQPSSLLHVVGGSATIPTLSSHYPLTISNNGNSGLNIISSGTTNAGQINFGDSGDADVGRIRYDHSDNSMRFSVNATERMRIDSSGNVGLGVTPNANWSSSYRAIDAFGGATFQFEANSTRQGQNFYGYPWKYKATRTATSIAHTSGGDISFQVAPSGTADSAITWSQAMLIKNTGKVGIGTASPNLKLHVEENADAWVGEFKNVRSAGGYGLRVDMTAGASATDTRFALGVYTPGNTGLFVKNNGNVGIGLTNQAHLLDILKTGSGDATINIKSTTGGDPTIIFNSAAANRSGLLRFQDNGTNVGRIEYVHNGDRIDFQAGSATGATMSVVNGKVGIGTTAPSAEVPLTAVYSSTSQFHIGGAQAGISNNVYYNGSQYTNRNTGAGGALLQLGTDGSFAFRRATSGSSPTLNYSMYLDGTGNVGIGTASPADRLHISGGNILLNNALEIRTKDTGGNIRTVLRANSSNELEYGWSANAPVKFMGGGSYTERMRIHTNGNIGIGTSSPGAPLHIQTNDGTTNTAVNSLMITNLSTGTTTTGFGGEIRFQAERNNGVMQNTGGIRSIAEVNSGTNISSGLAFDTSAVGVNSEKLRISYDGKVLIGDTASVTSDLLQIESPASGGGGGIHIRRNDSNNDQQVGILRFGNNSNANLASIIAKTDGSVDNGKLIFKTRPSGSGIEERMVIEADGNVGIGTATPQHELIVASTGNTTLGLVGSGYDDAIAIRFGGGDLSNALGNGNSGAAIISQQAVAGGQAKGDLRFQINTGDQLDTAMFISNAGNVGIGTAVPGTSKLKVYNSTATGNTQLHIHNDKTSDAAVLKLEGKRTSLNDTGQLIFANNGNNVAKIDARSAADDGELRFFTSASGTGTNMTQRMVIDKSGAVLVHYTAPSGNEKFGSRGDRAQIATTSSNYGKYEAALHAHFTASQAKYIRIQMTGGNIQAGMRVHISGNYSNVNAIGSYEIGYTLGANSVSTSIFSTGTASSTITDLGGTSSYITVGSLTKPNNTTIYLPVTNSSSSYEITFGFHITIMGEIDGISSIDIINQ